MLELISLYTEMNMIFSIIDILFIHQLFQFQDHLINFNFIAKIECAKYCHLKIRKQLLKVRLQLTVDNYTLYIALEKSKHDNEVEHAIKFIWFLLKNIIKKVQKLKLWMLLLNIKMKTIKLSMLHWYNIQTTKCCIN